MKHLVIDIETIPDQSEYEFEASLIKAPSNYRDQDKINTYIVNAKKALLEKMALKDSAAISIIGAMVDNDIFIFCNFPAPLLPGINCFPAKSEKEMMVMFGVFLEMFSARDRIITFNGYGFDLPKIRLHFAKNDLHVPDVLGNDHIDLMLEFTKRFSVNKNPFVSLSEVCHRLGIDGKSINGKHFFEMIEKKEYEKAIIYNAFDLIKTFAVFRKITR